MLNLTPEPITLIAASGETTTIEPSCYVARVEMDRRNPDNTPFFQWLVPDDLNGHYACVFIVEEKPRDIVLVRSATLEIVSWSWANPRTTTAPYIVTREVAEAAHALSHPLAARMVWAADERVLGGVRADDLHAGEYRLGYRELRRVAGVAR